MSNTSKTKNTKSKAVEKVEKALDDFLLEIKKIEKDHEEKIRDIIKEINEEKLKKVRDELKI